MYDGAARHDGTPPDISMNEHIVLAIDAMGGDLGPEMVVPALELVIARHSKARILLTGDAARIRPLLARAKMAVGRVDVQHCEVAIGMHDKPSQALRRGRGKSSMWQAIEAVRTGVAQVAPHSHSGVLHSPPRVPTQLAPLEPCRAICRRAQHTCLNAAARATSPRSALVRHAAALRRPCVFRNTSPHITMTPRQTQNPVCRLRHEPYCATNARPCTRPMPRAPRARCAAALATAPIAILAATRARTASRGSPRVRVANACSRCSAATSTQRRAVPAALLCVVAPLVAATGSPPLACAPCRVAPAASCGPVPVAPVTCTARTRYASPNDVTAAHCSSRCSSPRQRATPLTSPPRPRPSRTRCTRPHAEHTPQRPEPALQPDTRHATPHTSAEPPRATTARRRQRPPRQLTRAALESTAPDSAAPPRSTPYTAEHAREL